jgi:hypothetical protein
MMNPKHKRQIKKKINRMLAAWTLDFFLNGNPNCELAFKYRVKQFTGIEL